MATGFLLAPVVVGLLAGDLGVVPVEVGLLSIGFAIGVLVSGQAGSLPRGRPLDRTETKAIVSGCALVLGLGVVLILVGITTGAGSVVFAAVGVCSVVAAIGTGGLALVAALKG
jgi:hypothetical protein